MHLKSLNYISIGGFLFTLVMIVFFVYHSINDDVLDPLENRLSIDFVNKSKVYVLAKSWGVTGNHQQITFSEKPIKVPNKKTDYIFYTDEVYYKIKGDSLIVFTANSGKSIPNSEFKNIEVYVNGLKNYNELKDYSDNYKMYGLERITVNINE